MNLDTYLFRFVTKNAYILGQREYIYYTSMSRFIDYCRNMNSAIIKGGSARDLKVDGCGDK